MSEWRRKAVAVALILVGPALVACGDDEEPGSETPTAAASTITETTTVTDSGHGSGEEGGPPPADLEVSKLTQFQSPTGNIGCVIEPLSVRCDIGERDWSPPPAPAACELDFGQGIELSAGTAAQFVCAGDTTLGAGGIELKDGRSISAGLLRCESVSTSAPDAASRDGISCRDIETGRGFSISREEFELF